MAFTEALESLSRTLTNFMCHMGSCLESNIEGNICWSPPILFALLCLFYRSAIENTAEALENLLGVENLEMSAADCQMLINVLINLSDVKFQHGSAIFVKDIEAIEPGFIKNAEKIYDTSVLQLQYDKKGRAYKKISTWLEKQTTKKIGESFIPNDYNEQIALLLLSSCYWRADWLEKFDHYEAKKDAFAISDNESVQCRMIKMACIAKYGDRDDISAQVVCIPFKNPRCSILIILPRPRISLKDVARKMLGKDLHDLYEHLFTSPILATLPKLKLEHTIDFQSTLSQLGLEGLFTGSAEFPGILIKSNVKVDSFIQKVVVETGERGTALPKTEIPQVGHMRAIATHSQNRCAFNANRPFLFYIIYHDHKCFLPLVVGRIVRPM